MKVEARQSDFDTVELTITATGKEFDPLAPQLGGGTPYNGTYSIDWGDNGAWQIVEQEADDPETGVSPPIVVTHNYPLEGAWRIHVHGDVRITVHALSSHVYESA